jgi:periplasmic divalent cation tolerance protein
MDSEFVLVLCTCPDRKSAAAVTTAVLAEKLAACVNRLGDVQSMYHWEGRLEKDEEFLLLIKTTARQFPSLEELIRRLHPYEIPEIIGLPLTIGSQAYFDWIRNSVQPSLSSK